MTPRLQTASRRRTSGLLAFSSLAALLATATLNPAQAAITNTATASGNYGTTSVISPGAPASVDVAPAAGALTISKSAGAATVTAGTDATITDGGDTITFTFTVTNTGDVTLSNVTPVDSGPTFGGIAGTGVLGAFTLKSGTLPLAPDAVATFEADYSLSDVDAYHAAGITGAVANSATAKGTLPDGVTDVTTPTPGTTTSTIAAGPMLTITKSASLNDTNGTVTGKAELNEVITYTYTITNTGNVALTGVTVNDVHEGVALAATSFTGEALSSDGPLALETPAVVSVNGTLDDGIWNTLQPGATITMTYTHTVTQAEVDAQ